MTCTYIARQSKKRTSSPLVQHTLSLPLTFTLT